MRGFQQATEKVRVGWEALFRERLSTACPRCEGMGLHRLLVLHENSLAHP